MVNQICFMTTYFAQFLPEGRKRRSFAEVRVDWGSLGCLLKSYEILLKSNSGRFSLSLSRSKIAQFYYQVASEKLHYTI